MSAVGRITIKADQAEFYGLDHGIAFVAQCLAEHGQGRGRAGFHQDSEARNSLPRRLQPRHRHLQDDRPQGLVQRRGARRQGRPRLVPAAFGRSPDIPGRDRPAPNSARSPCAAGAATPDRPSARWRRAASAAEASAGCTETSGASASARRFGVRSRSCLVPRGRQWFLRPRAAGQARARRPSLILLRRAGLHHKVADN